MKNPITLLVIVCTPLIPSTTIAANLLRNGDFQAPAVLGPGQTQVPEGRGKLIQTNPLASPYSDAISGVSDWVYALPSSGTNSDHGLSRQNALFGLSAGGQFAFINNWNRMMSQTVTAIISPGDTVTASIQFGTLGSPLDNGRAGRFYLVAGEANSPNLDTFSSRSIILDELSIANPSWTGFIPDVSAGNGTFIPLSLSYTFQPNDPALGLPLTVAFRTVTSSVGPTQWDNASLTVVPEPSTLLLASSGAALCLSRKKKRQPFRVESKC